MLEKVQEDWISHTLLVGIQKGIAIDTMEKYYGNL